MIRDRTIVTVAHVVAGSDSVEVVAADGRTVTVDVVHFDPELDLAVLRAGRDVGSPLPSQSTSVTDGAATVALPRLAGSDGHVGLLDVEVVRRVTIRTTDIYREAEVERRGTEVVADIEPGDSGAMVHAAGGNAGIIWARSNVRSGRAWSVELPDAVVGRAPALERPVDVQHCVD